MYRDRDDLGATHFGGQAVQEAEWVDFPPSSEEPSRVPARTGRSVVVAPPPSGGGVHAWQTE